MLETETTQDTAPGPRPAPAPFPRGWDLLARAERRPGARVVVVPDEGSDPPRTLADLLGTAAAEPGASALAEPVSLALGRLAEKALDALGGSARVPELLDRAILELPSAIDASPAAAAEATAEGSRQRGRVPSDAEAILLDARGPFRIATRLLRRERRDPRRRVLGEMRELADAVRARLRADEALSPEASSPERLSAGLGAAGSLLDAGALSRALPTARGSKRLEPGRRERLEHLAAELAEGLLSIPAEPDVVVVGPTGTPSEMDGADRVRTFHAPLASAAGLFDGLASERVRFVRAARAARMELDSGSAGPSGVAFLEALDWQGLDRGELALLPAVLVLETGSRLRAEQLGGLSRLLRSGRPVAALVVESLDELHRDESWDAIAGFHPGLGYLAVAHREAFVLQSSVIRPDHLAAGLVAAARATQPAAVFVTVPREGAASWDRPALAAALAGRATPLLRYDPAAGESWAERFDLDGNPEPEAVWPRSGGDTDERWTFVHFAACEPALHPHVLGAAAEAGDPRLVPVAEWLAASEDLRARRIPVIDLIVPGGEPARVVVGRPAAYAALDRMRAWRILQELAGFHNEHARRAAERARSEAEDAAAAERAERDAAHALELERVRLEAATEAVDRIVAALLGQAAAGPVPASPPVPAVTEAAPAAAPAAGPVEAAPEEEVLPEEPWIDSALCTTCNECTNLNGRMFRYNANKQAVLADASAGTFEELVRAAEKCPARCIHTGSPPTGDASVTDELRARAAKFR